ncbi:MAG: hypothetical protein VXZ96_06115 [Myxococcota bacterium]|nr:hypothetical protein [Myxococcota bacterium]
MRKNAFMSESPSIIMVRTSPDNPSGEALDLDTLRNWVRSGRIGREQQIFDPQQQLWIPAFQFGPISSIFTQQLWDAWEDEDEFTEPAPVKGNAPVDEDATVITPRHKAISEGDKKQVESTTVEFKQETALSSDKLEHTQPLNATVEAELEVSKDGDPIADVLAMFDEHSAAEAAALRQNRSPQQRQKNLPLPPKVEPIVSTQSKKRDIEELPMSALEPLVNKPFVSQKPQRTPRSPKPLSNKTPRSSHSKVPSQGPRVRKKGPPPFSMDHGDAFRLPLNAQSFPTRRPPVRRSGVRWGRILVIISPFVMILLVIRWYVGATATAQFPTSEQLDQNASPSGFADLSLLEEDDPLFELDTALRSQIRPACLSITPETLVEDVMTVELDAFDIDVIGIRASIVEWTGRKLDRPRTGTFRFRVKGDDSYEYQLAAIALVVGKYMENYVMDVAKLEVTIDTKQNSMQFELDPDLVSRYYRQNIDLRQLFNLVQ